MKETVMTDVKWLQVWQLSKQQLPIEELTYNLCTYFIGTPYQLLADPIIIANSLEQLLKSLAYNDEFSFTLSSFDCVTFVETVLALVFARHCRDIDAFTKVVKSNLLSLRYRQGIPTFLRRNYFFTCVDWIPNNQWSITDITTQICNMSLVAKTYINKLNWLYNHKLLATYRAQITLAELDSILSQIGSPLIGKDSIIPYISIENLLANYSKYLTLFPAVSIICIVRPNWDVTDVYANYGTHLNISHMGICLKKQDELYFYHASSVDNKIVTLTKLTDYLTNFLDSLTIKGINILNCKF